MLTKTKSYIPGPFHLTTLLNIFIPLFNRVRKHVQIEEIRTPQVPLIFKEVSSIPVTADQQPFVLNSENSELSLTQECILDCVRVVVQEQLDPQSKIRAGIPDMLRLLLDFVEYAIRPPLSKFPVPSTPTPNEAVQMTQQKNLIAFAELSLRTVVEYYAKVANFPEVIQETILVDIVKRLEEPLALKYHCPHQSTWKIAATSLIKVGQIGLPLAREQLELYTCLWPQLANTIEGFLFSPSKSAHPLNADERKRHEYVDCLVIELIRNEILPCAGRLPRDFTRRIIDILNRGSINTMDANDLMASDSFQQRADLSRVCFDALLSMSRTDTPDLLKIAGGGSASDKRKVQTRSVGFSQDMDSAAGSTALGATAIASLLSRCKQVLNNYARDEQGSGHFRLPQERIFETISVLRAVSTLIDGLAKHGNTIVDMSHATLYSQLVGLHPSLVQLIPSCRGDQQVELALMTALNSYQTLLLINIHKSSNQQNT
ncbi:monensin-resistant like protein 2 [Ditylenchus destructor]|uniref:Monensin-resistant like protein 2 n=1 Tax=Ditylenchus destructor TaxID=166010 RepID=A0AAD4QZ39_9BILA|nr:monensin-resistant like protein 2 [Ditylenchus destructor]